MTDKQIKIPFSAFRLHFCESEIKAELFKMNALKAGYTFAAIKAKKDRSGTLTGWEVWVSSMNSKFSGLYSERKRKSKEQPTEIELKQLETEPV